MPRPFPRDLLPEFDASSLEELTSLVAVAGADHDEGGGSYFDGIRPPLRDVYQAVFAKAIATGKVFDEVYECSSPERRRIFRCRALPIRKDALIVEHTPVIDADPVRVAGAPALAGDAPRTGEAPK